MNTNESIAEEAVEELGAEDIIATLKLIAERAGKIILAYYVEGEEIAVREKDDTSPVTEADEAAETFILGALNTLTPDIPVVAEEAMAAGEAPVIEGNRFWLVDPLDGTKEFISRNGEFTVNIALIEDGQPVAGVVHAPAMAMTWAGVCGETEDGDKGSGQAVFAETDKPVMDIRVRKIPSEGAVVVASRRHGAGKELDDFLSRYTVAEKVSAGSSLKFCLVASGRADVYPRFGRTMEWDTAAGHAVLLAAGGQVYTLDDEPLDYGKPDFENPHFYALGDASPD
ncbi:3'(2'),5'-bisphosphate nucleotidase CysQ [Pelagibius litoralis]|uniref:3'(2'),5'-bisphosphate nucleotidase CysQ n=1 Tax=Pelagibius litoralis TaxID=374515 RepID=UPI002AC350E7|nr:3'(2'),5'-bisphosphate nucleotidase CysQ [Pelagibius litoralis]